MAEKKLFKMPFNFASGYNFFKMKYVRLILSGYFLAIPLNSIMKQIELIEMMEILIIY